MIPQISKINWRYFPKVAMFCRKGNKTRNFCVIYKILDKKESSIYHVIVPLEVTEFTHLTIDNDPGTHLHIFINYSNML